MDDDRDQEHCMQLAAPLLIDYQLERAVSNKVNLAMPVTLTLINGIFF